MHFPGLSNSGSGTRVVLKGADWLGLHFVPFPGLRSSGNQVLGEHTVPGVRWVLSPLWSQSLGLLGVPQEHRHRCAVCLLLGADLRLQPSWQMSTVQYPRNTWFATGSLLPLWWRMPSLGPKLPLAFQLWLSPACLSASDVGEEPVGSLLALLWHLINTLFCERARMWLRLELFFLSLSLFPLSLSVCPTVWVAISR